MKIVTLQRLSFLAALPLCMVLAMATAHAEEPPAPSEPPASLHSLHGNDLVNIGRDSNLPLGESADSVVSIFGSSTCAGDANDVVSIFGDSRITGEVSDSAVAVLGNMYIDGKVDGDVVAVLGDIELGPHAEIKGDVVAVGGTLQRDSAAIIHGSVQNVLAVSFGGFEWLHTWIHKCLFYGRPLALASGLGWAWKLAFAFLALYLVLALLFREGLTQCVQTFETQPGRSVLAALIAMLLTPVLVVLLCVTVIGIPAVPFVVFGLFCVGLFGKAVMLAWLGRRITGKRGEDAMGHPAAAVLIGGLLVLVLYLVPVIGFIVYKLLGWLGFGAVVYTVILAVRAHQAAKAGPAGPTPAPAAAPAPPPPPRPAPAPAPDAAVAGAAAFSAAAASNAAPEAATGHDSGALPPGGAAPAPGPGPAASPAAGAAPRAAAPQPVSASLPRAGFWIRMGALLLDVILVGFFMSLFHHTHLELVMLAAYGAVMWKVRGSTVGGIVFDLHVVRLDGRELDWETAIIRALGCFLSLAVAGLGFIWIAFDANRQAWHDKIAGTVVVRVAKSPPLV
jgi:uncharacterized RDD family membrane protein YckC/cytoskeletal protein CcmA (bactofilin family)